jgi:hypothetical protein
MNIDSGDAVMVVAVGLGLFSMVSEVVRELLLRVSLIILAKPMIMVMMIPTDRKPPVKVRY